MAVEHLKWVSGILAAGLVAVAGGGWFAYDAAETESARLSGELEQVRAALARAEQAVAAARDERQVLSETAARADKQMRAELAGARAEIERLGEQRDRLQASAGEALAVADRHRAALARIESLETELAAAERRQDELREARARVERERVQLTTELDQARAGQQRLREALAASRAEREELRESVNAALDRQERQKTELAAAQAQRIRLQTELATVNAEIDRQQQAVGQTRSQLQATLAEKQRLQGEIEAASVAIDEREAAVEQSRQAVADLRQRVAAAYAESLQLGRRLQSVEREREAEAERFARLQSDLERAVHSREVRIEQLEDRLTLIKLGEEILFESGSARLKPSGRRALALIAETLNDFPQRKVSVEGHTDSVPIGSSLPFESNWELSAARAAAAVRYLQVAAGVAPDRLTVVGHGQYRPIADNADRRGRAANRRIEILLSSPPADVRELASGGVR